MTVRQLFERLLTVPLVNRLIDFPVMLWVGALGVVLIFVFGRMLLLAWMMQGPARPAHAVRSVDYYVKASKAEYEAAQDRCRKDPYAEQDQDCRNVAAAELPREAQETQSHFAPAKGL